MPHIIRVRKDIIDPRPIRVYQGPKSYRYRWKMMALLSLNEDGQFVLPFSQRLVHIDLPLWPRSHGTPAPPGYEECGCIGCEYKTYADHILKDDDDDNTSESGNLHLEEVYIESEDEKDADGDEPNETSEHENNDSSEGAIVSSTTTSNNSDMNLENDNNNHQHDSSDESMSISLSLSPFPCDPYESYDWEC